MTMISPDDLARAVRAGVIDQAAAERLSAFMQAAPRDGTAESNEDEQLRLVSGFGDIFVAIGLVLFLGALYFVLDGWHPAIPPAVIAIASWGLAELFTRLRRQALPSILLMIVFAGSVFAAAAYAFDAALSDSSAVILAGPVTCAAVALHWWRFHVPVTVAAACAAATATVLALASSVFGDVVTAFGGLVFLPLGLAVFALAMRFDTSDRQRRTRRTDIAFWLHALAAPMVVHPVMQNIMQDGAPGTGATVLIFLVFALLGLVALTVDRRAMLVSSLLYLGYAIYAVLQAGEALPSTSLVVLLVGAVVLGLSLAWRPLRAALLKILPAAITARVPPAHLTSFKTG